MWTPTTHADDVSKDKGEAGNTPVSFPLSKSAGGLVAVDFKEMVVWRVRGGWKDLDTSLGGKESSLPHSKYEVDVGQVSVQKVERQSTHIAHFHDNCPNTNRDPACYLRR